MQSRLIDILKDKGYLVHTVSPNTTVYDCAKKMNEHGIGALLVIENNQLIGIVSERDIIRKLVIFQKNISDAKVADIMSREIVSVSPTTTVTVAMRLITEKRFRHLPVLEEGKLIGLISIGDLTRWAMLAQEQEIDSLTKYIHGEH